MQAKHTQHGVVTAKRSSASLCRAVGAVGGAPRKRQFRAMNKTSTESSADDFTTELLTTSSIGLPAKQSSRLTLSLIWQLIFGLLILLTNALFILVVKQWKSAKSSIRTTLCHLAVADMLYGAVAFIKCVLTIMGINTSLSCRLLLGLLIWSGTCSCSFILLLAIDVLKTARSVTNVSSPHADGSSGFRANLKALVCWVVWGGIVIWGVVDVNDVSRLYPCFFATKYYKTSYILLTSVVVLLHVPCVVACNVATLATTWWQVRNLQTRVAPLGNTGNQTPENGEGSTTMSSINHLIVVQKMAKVTFMVSLIYLLTWGPYLTYIILHCLLDDVTLDPATLMAMGLLTGLNAIANIFIYSIRSKQFRIILKDILIFRNTVHPFTTSA